MSDATSTRSVTRLLPRRVAPTIAVCSFFFANVAAFLIGGWSNLTVATHTDSPPKTITAEQIVVIDKTGQKRVEILGGSINLFDEKGIRRACVNASEGGASVRYFSGNNEALMRLESSSSGASFSLEETQKNAVTLTPRQFLMYRRDKRRIEISCIDEALPRIVIRDKLERDRATLGLLEQEASDSLPLLDFMDCRGVSRIRLGGGVPTSDEEKDATQPGAYVIFHDSRDRPIWWAPRSKKSKNDRD